MYSTLHVCSTPRLFYEDLDKLGGMCFEHLQLSVRYRPAIAAISPPTSPLSLHIPRCLLAGKRSNIPPGRCAPVHDKVSDSSSAVLIVRTPSHAFTEVYLLVPESSPQTFAAAPNGAGDTLLIKVLQRHEASGVFVRAAVFVPNYRECWSFPIDVSLTSYLSINAPVRLLDSTLLD